jgi:predicted transcriptional regulator of viral defense system
MRNADEMSKRILKLVAALPSFATADLAPIGEKPSYLNIILSRHAKRGAVLRLRRDLYVAKSFVDNVERKGIFSDYVEFTANNLYPPSYLSLDYVLHEHNMLTDIPRNMTSVGLRKTDQFSNELGNFIYHKIKDDLFTGFTTVKKGNFLILKATKVKALFDFLYFRKRVLVDKGAVDELRLNLDEFTEADFDDLEKYVSIERSPRIKEIVNWLR